ncbi:MAG: hypothetical protein ACHREM_18990 [Polyangiales bacterium]
MSRKPTTLHAAPLAIASTGELLLGVHWSSAAESLDEVIAIATGTGRPIFVGVALSRSEGAAIFKDLDDAVHDTVCRLGTPLLKPRKTTR